jgi:PPM family protein phosphatase
MSQAVPRARLTISHGEACDRGKVREENQDSVRHSAIPLGELFLVADGIGGYQGGATASRMVVEGFHTHLAAQPANYPAKDALRQACTSTNASIHAAGHNGDPSVQRMGSTVVLALLQTGLNGKLVAYIGHVGDSRAYLIRDRQMRRVTTDHSAVQALLSRNLLTEEEARNHPDSSVLTRSLGHRPDVEIEIGEMPLQPGDALLLCSDGLWGYVADGDIAAVATESELAAQTVADTLLHQALAAGGQDNIGIEFIRIACDAGASAPPRAAIFPKNQAASAGAVPARARRIRIQQIAAIILLLVAVCGYLGYAAHRQIWPFRPALKIDPVPQVPAAPAAGEGAITETPGQTKPTTALHIKAAPNTEVFADIYS